MNGLFSVCGRGGSKGVKDKNIRPFLGAPLYAHTLRAIELYIGRYQGEGEDYGIVVSTDSQPILRDLGGRENCLLRNRPENLAQDDTPKMPVIWDALQYAEEKNGRKYDYVIDLDITSPLRRVRDIRGAYEKKRERVDAQVVYSVTHSRRSPYFNMVKQKGDFYSTVIPSDAVVRQQAPSCYDMNASIYVYDREFLASGAKTPLQGRGDIILMRDTGVIDIDSEEDFQMMEWIAERLMSGDGEYREIFCLN